MEENKKGLVPILKINLSAMTEDNDLATIEDLIEAFDMDKSPIEFIKMLLDEGLCNIYLYSWDEKVKLL